jgi:hypothetical protein
MYVAIDDDTIYYIDAFSREKTCVVNRYSITLLSEFYTLTVYTEKEIFDDALEFANRCNEQRILPSTLIDKIIKEMIIDKVNRTITDTLSTIVTDAVTILPMNFTITSNINTDKDNDNELSV